VKYYYNQKEIFPVVEVYHDIIPYLSGIGMKDFYMDREKCVFAWKTTTKILKGYFGDLFPMRKPAPPPISVVHIRILLWQPVNTPKVTDPIPYGFIIRGLLLVASRPN